MLCKENTYRLRVENCIGTIIDVHKKLGVEFETLGVMNQFKKLQDTVDELDMKFLCEGDILMVEKATNALLSEFKTLFETARLGPIYTEEKS